MVKAQTHWAQHSLKEQPFTALPDTPTRWGKKVLISGHRNVFWVPNVLWSWSSFAVEISSLHSKVHLGCSSMKPFLILLIVNYFVLCYIPHIILFRFLHCNIINLHSYIWYPIILLLLLSHFSRVQLCVTPETAAHQSLPSLGFSRQEHWSGLPFPSPMHESEMWKGICSVVSNSLRPHELQPTRLLHPWDFPGKSTGVSCHCLLQYRIIVP